MIPYEKRILNSLLDSFEKSSLMRGENKVRVRISYRFDKRNLPEYFDESSTAYEEIHAVAYQMEQKGFLEIVWKNKKVGHIIEKVLLCEEAIDEVYHYMKRTPKLEQESRALMMLMGLAGEITTPAAGAFLARMRERLQAGKSIKGYADIACEGELGELIRTIMWVEGNTEELFFREFSSRYFHDSKKFALLAGKVCKILQEECDEFAGMEKEDILAEYQIYHTPGYVYLKGNAGITFEEPWSMMDISGFTSGLGFGIDNNNADSLRIIPGKDPVYEVYTIENLTTFFRFTRENSLIVYLGGYHNQARRKLLLKIYDAYPDAKYYHFGDIDAGGFQIFWHLREKTGIPFTMYQMNREILEKYQEYGKTLTEHDRKRLMQMREASSDVELRETIAYMLEWNVKLEQECVME